MVAAQHAGANQGHDAATLRGWLHLAVDEKESALRSAELRLERRSEPFDTPRRRQILEHINDAQKRHGTARTRLERARAATQQQAAMLRELSTTRQMVEEDLLRTVRDVPGGSDATPKTLAHLRQETRAGLHRPRDWPDRGLWMAAFDDEEKCISQLEAARRARDAIRGELRSSQRQEEEWTSRLKIAEEAAWRAEARKVEREREELNKRRQAADRLADAAEEAQQREARRRRDRRAVHQHRLDEVMAVMRALVRVAKSGGGHTMRQLRPGILGMICPREREVTMQIEVGRGAGLTVTARLDVARRDLEQRAQVSARFDGCLLGLRQVTLAYVDSSDAIVTVSQDLPGPGWTLTPLATTESAEILAGAVLAAIFEVQTHWHQWGVELRPAHTRSRGYTAARVVVKAMRDMRKEMRESGTDGAERQGDDRPLQESLIRPRTLVPSMRGSRPQTADNRASRSVSFAPRQSEGEERGRGGDGGAHGQDGAWERGSAGAVRSATEIMEAFESAGREAGGSSDGRGPFGEISPVHGEL